mgnify:FL=1|jgi:hypothetical protein
MSRKLILSILILSFAFLELLAVRQQQINTVHVMTQLHHAINSGNDEIIGLTIKIETACSPSHIQQSIASTEFNNENNE